jgi:hypothetical protein
MTGEVDTATFLRDLVTARAAGRAEVEIDFNRVCHPNSPVPFGAHKARIAYFYVAAVVVAGVLARSAFEASWTATLLVVLAFSVIYWTGLKRLLELWAKRRIVALLLANEDAWEKIWRFGGVTLRITGSEAAMWVAPKGRWKDAHKRLRGWSAAGG